MFHVEHHNTSMTATTVTNEFHPNGRLAYTASTATLSKDEHDKYPNARVAPDGTQWIYNGVVAKHYNNGQLAWQLNYDETGAIIKDGKPSYRRDGTIIQH